MPTSVFAKYSPKAYPYTYHGTIHVPCIAGGIPGDPKVAEGWLKSKMGWESERMLQQAVAEVMVEREVPEEEAITIVNENKNVNGFKRDKTRKGELYIEGRQLKAAIKESANVRWPYPHKWGRYQNTKSKEVGGKSSPAWFAEHVFVMEDKLHLGVTEPSGVAQRFVHTWRGSGIQYEEFCNDVEFDFTITTDYKFTDEQWGLLWTTGEQQGIGATRSQGYGVYSVVKWEPK